MSQHAQQLYDRIIVAHDSVRQSNWMWLGAALGEQWVHDDIKRIGITTMAQLQSFMDGFEAHANARGRTDLTDLKTLISLRHEMKKFARIEVVCGQPWPEADPIRLAGLQSMVRGKASEAAIAGALNNIIYRDLDDAPEVFMQDFGRFLLDEGFTDLAQSSVIADKVDGLARDIISGYVPAINGEESLYAWVEQGICNIVYERVLADASSIAKVPPRYLEAAVKRLPLLDQVTDPKESENVSALLSAVGLRKMESIRQELRTTHEAALRIDESGREGGMPDAYYTQQRLDIHETLIAKLKQESAMTDKKLQATVTKITPEYAGRFLTINQYEIKKDMHEGGTQDIKWLIMERGNAVGILAYDPAEDKVILVNEMRPGILAAGGYPYTDTLPAGGIGKGETPVEAAIREMREETGLELKDARIIHDKAYVSAGGTSESISIVFGTVAAKKAGGIHGLASESENIKTTILSSDEFMAQIRSGQINDMKTIIAGYWLMENRAALRKQQAPQVKKLRRPGA